MVEPWESRVFLLMTEVRTGFGLLESVSVKSTPSAKPLSLQRLLLLGKNTEASDPKDKVYAFLGISSDFSTVPLPRCKGNTSGNLIIPDYLTPVREVYINTVKAIVQMSQSLDILSQVQDEPYREIKDLPSWVPDF